MSQSRERQLRAKSGREQTQQISPLFDHRVGSGENTLLPIVHVEVDNVGREMVLPGSTVAVSGIVPYFSARSET
jgi:hypothetical protein